MSSLTINYYLQESKSTNDSTTKRSPSTTQVYKALTTYPVIVLNFLQSLSFLDVILSLDILFTSRLAICAHPLTTFQKILRFLCYILEITGHGVSWFSICGCLAFLYFITQERILWIYSFNLFVILVLDIILVAPIKLYFQRPRPSLNRGRIPLSISSVDKYAFPSGHTSRCVSLASLFCYLLPFRIHTNLFCLWAVLVCISRVVIGRHHISDVVVGVIAGVAVFQASLHANMILT